MVVSEGANTMDMARLCLSDIIREPKTRIDAATWGTMGIGLGAAIASAVARPDRITVAIEGDSAFGFSGMELETMVRYKLPIVVIVMNNGGIYGGDRRASGLQGAAEAGLAKSGLASDPAPTAFVPDSRYDLMMKAFHGKSYRCSRAHELQDALSVTLREARLPCLIDVILDPLAGVESGNVHSFNLAKI
jgi:2-hydroxyacyl-CoA lyase 1